jgi:mRNA interferase MazF
VISRGSVCWVDLGEPRGSRPAKVRPVLVLQDDAYNSSRLSTTIAAVITSNTAQAAVAGNVFIPASVSGLSKDSVANLTALVTLDKSELEPPVGRVPQHLMDDVDRGLRLILDL